MTELDPDLAELELAERELAARHLSWYWNRAFPDLQMGAWQLDLCQVLEEFLADVEAGKGPCLIIEAPPQNGKSVTVSRALPAWILGKHPDWPIILASYAANLAKGHGRWIRNALASPWHQQVFPAPGARLADDSQAIDQFSTVIGGQMLSRGIGGGTTGQPARIFVTDDPFADRKQADSPVTRETVWDWFSSVAQTRLAPGGGKLVMNCMVGDTRVALASGGEKCLRDIRPGDSIRTFDAGTLSTSTVENWINCGPDNVLAIRMTSGTVVRANERHPFLVSRPEGLTWVRVKNLRVGDAILRVTGENGAARPAVSRDAANQFPAKNAVSAIMESIGGHQGGDRQVATLSVIERGTCDADTESRSLTSMLCLPSKMASALCVDSPQRTLCGSGNIGLCGKDSVSITTTPPGKSGDCSVTTVTSPLDTGKAQQSSPPQPHISDFTADEIIEIVPAGREDVFDIEVERTANFIANGLVSHNTRWHLDDLVGRLLAQQEARPDGDRWKVVTYRALAEHGDRLGRKLDEPLFPERYSKAELIKKRATMIPRDWNALMQQNPVSDEGGYFKKVWFRDYTERPRVGDVAVAIDFAYKDGQENDHTCCYPFGLTETSDLAILPEWFCERMETDQSIERLLDVIEATGADTLVTGRDALQSIGPFLTKEIEARNKKLREDGKRLISVVIHEMPEFTDLMARARSYQASMQRGKVLYPRGDLLETVVKPMMLAFPAHKHDDPVATGAMMCWLLNDCLEYKPKPPEKWVSADQKRWDEIDRRKNPNPPGAILPLFGRNR